MNFVIEQYLLQFKIISHTSFKKIFDLQRQEGCTVEGGHGTTRMEGDALISRVNKAVTAITSRLQGLAIIDTSENKVSKSILFILVYQILIQIFNRFLN